jgi:NAD(P) transhydrogenase subunit alpha
VPGRLAADASSLYARNVYNFAAAFWDKEAKRFAVDWEDEIIKGVALTREGQVIHPQFGAADAAPEEGDVAAGAPAESGGGDADADAGDR